jgi:hypothetical protein
MTEFHNDNPLQPAPITEIFLWIGVGENGSEGLIASDFPIPPGVTRHMPLMSSDHELAKVMRPLAEEIAASSVWITYVELRRFKAVDS